LAIVRVALPVASQRLFDYWLPAGLNAVAGSMVTGVVVEVVDVSDVDPERLHPVEELVESLAPLPEDLRQIAQFTATYYLEPIGLCYSLMLPPGRSVASRTDSPSTRLCMTSTGRHARSTRRSPHQALPTLLATLLDRDGGAALGEIKALGKSASRLLAAWRRKGWVDITTEPVRSKGPELALNDAQRAAVDAALPNPRRFLPALLQGVTGSGKTEVYLAAAARVIAADGQALLLVPEINLTPQLEERIATALPRVRVGVLHSRMNAAARRAHWRAAAAGELDLVVGTRLAVFTPMPLLGLIVVDEEHDASYKQQDGVHYHARDVAVYRARLRDVPVLLGSATPSLESYEQARRGRYAWLKLPQRATLHLALPRVRCVPTRVVGTVEGISQPLETAIAARLQRGEQSLLFINRRGFAPALLCAACGWKAMCPRCDARLVVHRDAGQLRCHHCAFASPLPSSCPECGNKDLLPLGFGTQRLERALAERFPQARTLRIDRDSTQRKGSFVAMREAIADSKVDILVGTQMLAKGHDFPRLTLVGVLGADNALYSADFRATERLFAVLEQVSGRAGRGALAGEVIVQTDFPDHAVYAALLDHDYDRFASTLLEERETLGLPPYAYLALLTAEAKARDVVIAFLDTAVELGRSTVATQTLRCEVHAPVPAGLARRAGLERAQVLVQSHSRRMLQQFLQRWRDDVESIGERRVRWNIDVDPVSFA
jgi:primosomal protein N' (replication factor Y) (superfamily II helicase)